MNRLFLVACLFLFGCSTPYQEMGLSGGVRSQQLSKDTFRIIASGNGFTSATTVEDYVLLKAAETTAAQGATHFMIVGARDATVVGQTVVSPGRVNTSYSGNQAYSEYQPPTVSRYRKPGTTATIKLFWGNPPPSAQSAQEVIQFVGQRVRG